MMSSPAWRQLLLKQPRWLAFAELAAMLALIGWADDATGWEWSLFVFYAVPIAGAVHLGGLRAGMITAGVAAVVWWMANVTDHPYQTELGYVMAMTSRFVYFSVAAIAAAAMRTRRENDAMRIRMLEEHRQLEHDIVQVSEHEQQRIGRDLHDGLCQQLAAIACALRALGDELQPQHAGAADDVVHVEEMVRDAITEARSLAHGIFPVHVDRLGLATALSELATVTTRLMGTPVRLVESGNPQPPSPDAAMHLYRIAQEAVANAVKHSGAREVAICLLATPGTLELRVEDDGCGISDEAQKKSHSMGLRTMQYRAQALGSDISIKPRPGGGTVVSCCLNTEPSASK